MVRYAVTTMIFVEAADANDAALVIERDLAGCSDSELVSVASYWKACGGARCPSCGSERIEHHEDVVARCHFCRVDDDGLRRGDRLVR